MIAGVRENAALPAKSPTDDSRESRTLIGDGEGRRFTVVPPENVI
ncbi:hypothetical protein NJ7G_3502 [Natrinema sp. J7-2]|nr:hypothetical protein NJ7G_3502 [Natrinema sp. J7-2]